MTFKLDHTFQWPQEHLCSWGLNNRPWLEDHTLQAEILLLMMLEGLIYTKNKRFKSCQVVAFKIWVTSNILVSLPSLTTNASLFLDSVSTVAGALPRVTKAGKEDKSLGDSLILISQVTDCLQEVVRWFENSRYTGLFSQTRYTQKQVSIKQVRTLPSTWPDHCGAQFLYSTSTFICPLKNECYLFLTTDLFFISKVHKVGDEVKFNLERVRHCMEMLS